MVYTDGFREDMGRERELFCTVYLNIILLPHVCYSASYPDCMLGLYHLCLLDYALSFTFACTAGPAYPIALAIVYFDGIPCYPFTMEKATKLVAF